MHRLSISGHQYTISAPHSHKSKALGRPACHSPYETCASVELVACLPRWRAGYWLLRVLDVLAPGAVDWRAAHKPPLRPLLRRPQSIENCNQVRCASWSGIVLLGVMGLGFVGRSTRSASSGGQSS